jgi:hypothetical protein
MPNYATQILQAKLDEINFYIDVMKKDSPDEYRFMPDYDNLKLKRRHLLRVIAIIRLMDLNAI